MVGNFAIPWYNHFSMKIPWNKGLTKETNHSLMKTSRTMKMRKIDNFYEWRERMKQAGIMKSSYPTFTKDGDLAEFIGVILGDGHIEIFPRTERLELFSNASNLGFVNRYKLFMKNIFSKNPLVVKRSNAQCIKLSLYQKNISRRLGIFAGARKNRKIMVPAWILRNSSFLIRYLRGLYEAEGSFCVHQSTSTYKFLFSNRNSSLRMNVYNGMKKLGFHPHKSGYQIQISRKEEAYRAKDLLGFRRY